MTFLRTEIKYRLSAEVFRVLNREFEAHLEKDNFHFEKIHNIYYDNDSDEVIRRSLEKPVFKEKLRLRTYEFEGKLFNYVFSEMKNKFDGIGYKRRIKLPLSAARRLLSGADPAEILGDGQIARETLHFIKKTSSYPKLYLSYDRRAYRGKKECKDQQDLRITFDSNIVSRADKLDFCVLPKDKPLLNGGEYILEVKTAYGYPKWLTEILTEHKVYSTAFSKYGRIWVKGITNDNLEEIHV